MTLRSISFIVAGVFLMAAFSMLLVGSAKADMNVITPTINGQIDYYLHPGETVAAYNARIAAARGETATGTGTGLPSTGAGGQVALNAALLLGSALTAGGGLFLLRRSV